MLKNSLKEIDVTGHAVEQYRIKLLQWYGRDGPDEELKEELRMMVGHGKKGAILPGNLIEYTRGEMAVAVRFEGMDIVIITFLGDKTWRWWWKRKERGVTKSRKVVNAL